MLISGKKLQKGVNSHKIFTAPEIIKIGLILMAKVTL